MIRKTLHRTCVSPRGNVMLHLVFCLDCKMRSQPFRTWRRELPSERNHNQYRMATETSPPPQIHLWSSYCGMVEKEKKTTKLAYRKLGCLTKSAAWMAKKLRWHRHLQLFQPDTNRLDARTLIALALPYEVFAGSSFATELVLHAPHGLYLPPQDGQELFCVSQELGQL